MAEQLNATGIWPKPRSPWPSWGDGGQTVRTDINAETHWNPPSSKVLQPGEKVTYGMRISACPGGPRTRNAALEAVGEPVLQAVPGYTIATDMTTASLWVLPPAGATVLDATSSNTTLLTVGKPAPWIESDKTSKYTVFPVAGLARGRARVAVAFSDGTEAVAHYYVLQPLNAQVAAVAHHWSEVAWLPRDYPDPFGRGACVMPWDREDKRHRFDDGSWSPASMLTVAATPRMSSRVQCRVAAGQAHRSGCRGCWLFHLL